MTFWPSGWGCSLVEIGSGTQQVPAGAGSGATTLKSIQYLRGVAAMMVVFYHVFPQLQRMGFNYPEITAFSSGVDIFFVISGFVMTYSTARNPQIDGLTFLKNRIIRIVPLYWFFTLLMGVLLVFAPAMAQSSKFDMPHFAASLLFIPAVHPVLGKLWPIVVPGWTLNYEMFFYLIFALALAGGHRPRAQVTGLTLLVLLVLTLVPALSPVRGVAAFYTRSLIMEFGYGMLLAEFFLRRPLGKSHWWWLAIAFGGIGLAVSGAGLGRIPQAILTGIPAALIVLGTLYVPLDPKGAAERLAGLVGDASYSIYLSHYMAMSAIGQIWRRLFSPVPISWAGFTLAGPLICALVGVMIYQWIERPMTLRLNRRAGAGKATARKIVFVVAPSGQAGGGMGRVKDYILDFAREGDVPFAFAPLVTRDNRGFLVSVWRTLAAVVRIWNAHLTGELALVHVNLGDKASAVRKGLITVLARLSGARVIVHLHAVELDTAWRTGSRFQRWAIGVPFRMATSNIVLGDLWRRWLVDDLGVKPGHVDVLVNGVPAPPFTPRDHAAPREAVEILFLGNLLERKGVNDLIAALADLPPELPAWHMTFAGGGDIAGCIEKVAAAGLSDRVQFLGWVEQARSADLLANADVMVLPSYFEGLPLVILEALGAGTPVVTTSVGAIPQFIMHDQTALVIEPGDKVALCDSLRRLVADARLRQRLGDAGRREYETTFSLQVFRKNLLAIYDKVLARG